MRVSVTRWTDIGAACAGDEETWARLLAKYRGPVQAFVRAQGLAAQAEDLAQEVFLVLFQEGVLKRADPEQGRFRSLLQAVTRNVVRRHLAHGKAQKRGGGVAHLPLEAGDGVAAEQASFDREWTLNLLELALARLAEEHPRYHAAVEAFFLQGLPQKEVARTLEETPKDVRNLVFRGKRKLLEFMRAEVWSYSSSLGEYTDELASLKTLLGGSE